MLTLCCCSFATDNIWFIDTMIAVYKLGGPLVQTANIQNLLRIVSEGATSFCFFFFFLFCLFSSSEFSQAPVMTMLMSASEVTLWIRTIA